MLIIVLYLSIKWLLAPNPVDEDSFVHISAPKIVNFLPETTLSTTLTMHIRVRKIGSTDSEDDIFVNVSKMAKIQELRTLIEERINVTPAQQLLLFKGKQLIDDHTIIDYDIEPNNVIQLMIRAAQVNIEPEANTSDNANDKKVDKMPQEKLVDAKSKYYKVGDLIDVQMIDNGAWYEAKIINIRRKIKEKSEEIDDDENNLIFQVRSEEHVISFQDDVKFEYIRPRSFYTYPTSELTKGMVVLAGYNIEEPAKRGPWYEFKVEEVSRTSVKGAVLIGQDRAPITNCSLKFVQEIMRIEKPMLLEERKDVLDPPKRKYPINCVKCQDDNSKKCRECGCKICAGKENCDTLILCDECDDGYHIACLDPPLESVPEDDEWYCPECKTDDTEIVKAGEKLKDSNKKAKLASKQRDVKRDWGKGMACVGRSKECTIVPKNHIGPIPGIDVGTCWKFRFQVSESGIHRPHVAGIHGRDNDGAYSLVLSGGYEDDVDNGDEFYYTGSGGRDLSGNKRVSHQSCDQTLTRMNKALALNCNAPFNDKDGAESKDWKKGKAVRVVRNYKLAKHSKYAPKDGNRYDGLYKIVKYFPEKGKSGFIVWRYLLRRDDDTPAPWEKGGQELEMIYPEGYLEAQEAEKQKQKKDKENKTEPSTTKGSSSKRKRSEVPLTDFFVKTPKKSKPQGYKLDKAINEAIIADKENLKLWHECKEKLTEGKQKFLNVVEELFKCICCQEVVLNPVTIECKHNICKSCLKRSFSAEIYTCPYCRHDLGKDYAVEVNENLSKALKLLFPGYEASR